MRSFLFGVVCATPDL